MRIVVILRVLLVFAVMAIIFAHRFLVVSMGII